MDTFDKSSENIKQGGERAECLEFKPSILWIEKWID